MLVEFYGNVCVPVHGEGVFIVEACPESFWSETPPIRAFIRHIDAATTNQSYSTSLTVEEITDAIEQGVAVLRMEKEAGK